MKKEEILKVIGQLQYEISILDINEERLTGVDIRTEELKNLVNNVVLDDVNGSTLVEILKAQSDFKLAIEIQNHVAENVFTYIINEHGVKLTYEEWRKTVKTYYR